MSESHPPLYTTGEIAEACHVSVRTVQYYDEKGLLIPVERSEGGRRLYNDSSLEQLRTICLLKELGLNLKSIRGILREPHDNAALVNLLQEQKRQVLDDMKEYKICLSAIDQCILSITNTGTLPAEIKPSDIGKPMKQNALHQIKKRMLIEGILIDVLVIGALIYGILQGQWMVLIGIIPLSFLLAWELTRAYHRESYYRCPHCSQVFQPRLGEFTFAAHTPKTRKLTCTCCHTKDWCAEVPADTAKLA